MKNVISEMLSKGIVKENSSDRNEVKKEEDVYESFMTDSEKKKFNEVINELNKKNRN